MATIAAVVAGGSLGTLARYGLDVAIERRSVSLFPWSTFTINLSGCFLVGLLIAALVDRHHAPHWLRIGLVVGFCGAYTTFSTFAQERTASSRGKPSAWPCSTRRRASASACWPSSSARVSGACCSGRSTISRWLRRTR